MNSRRLELALKKQRLQLQCQAERAALGEYVAGLSPVFKVVDTTAAGLDWVRKQPYLLLGTAVAAMFMRPRLIFRWGMRGLSLWRLTQNLLRR